MALEETGQAAHPDQQASFGQTVAQMLMAKGIPVTLIDRKSAQIELSEEFGTKVLPELRG